LSFAQNKRDDIREILANIADDVIEREEIDTDFEKAEQVVQQMQRNGELNEFAVLEFAKRRQYAATVTSLAMLCSVPIEVMKHMLGDRSNEALLVAFKAGGLAWPTLRALLQDDLLGRMCSEDELKKLKNEYTKLAPLTARKLLEFWCEHRESAAP
jgi:hypothetical protein